MRTVAIITWLTFHEARQRRMVLVALALGLVFVLLFALGFAFIDGEIEASQAPPIVQEQTYNFLLLAGLYVVHFLTIMMAIFTSVDAISGEIDSHTIQTVVTKPLRRWQIVVGKWLGYSGMIGLYMGMLGGGVMLVVYLLSGYVPPNPLQALALLALEALVLLALSLLGGARLATMTNGVLLFMLYGLAFIGAWVEQIGALLQSSAAVRIGIISSLLLPVEALWRRAAYLMQPPLNQSLPVSPFSIASVPSPAMVVYAGFYAAGALGLAIYLFSRRDL